MPASFRKPLTHPVRRLIALLNGRIPAGRRRRSSFQTEPLEIRQLLAADVQLVSDLHTLPAGQNSPLDMIDINGVVFFAAEDFDHGLELWKTDGTTEGTVRLTDLKPGPEGSGIAELTNLNGVLYFRGEDFEHGAELWKSDGTAEGTVLVKDLNAGPFGSFPSSLATNADSLYFSVYTSEFGYEPGVSDGTTNGTEVIDGTPGWQVSGYISQISTWNNIVYYTVSSDSGSDQIWRTDGTLHGTSQITNFSDEPRFRVWQFLTDGDLAGQSALHFVMYDAMQDAEVWTLDESETGGHQVSNFSADNSGFLTSHTTLNGRLYVTAGLAAFVENTASGTFSRVQISDSVMRIFAHSGRMYALGRRGVWTIDVGTLAATLTTAFPPSVSFEDGQIPSVTIEDIVYFGNASYVSGPMLAFDAGTQTIRTVSTPRIPSYYAGNWGPSGFIGSGRRLLWFGMDETTGVELWGMQHEDASPTMIREFLSGTVGSDGRFFVSSANSLFAYTDRSQASYLPAITEFSVDWTVSSILKNGYPIGPAGNESFLYYVKRRSSGIDTIQIWNDQSSVPQLLATVPGSLIITIHASESGAYFIVRPRNDVIELWYSDGTSTGTRKLSTLDSDYSTWSQIDESSRYLWFSTTNQTTGIQSIHVSDGSAEGTITLPPLSDKLILDRPVFLNGSAYFSDRARLFRSHVDGSEVHEVDLAVEKQLYLANPVSAVAGRLLFEAQDAEGRLALFSWDPVSDDLARIAPLNGVRNFAFDFGEASYASFGNSTLFFKAISSTETELWITDGSQVGTRFLTRHVSDFRPKRFSMIGDRAFYQLKDSATGQIQLWVTDGTEDGTFQIRTSLGSRLQFVERTNLIQFSDSIVFRGVTEETGDEPYRLIATAPDAIEDVTVASVPQNAIRASWTDVAGAVQYEVRFQSLTHSELTQIQKRVTGTDYTSDSGIQPGVYRLEVRGLGLLGDQGEWSSPIEFVVGSTPILRSMGVTITDTTPQFSWWSPLGVSSYNIWLTNRDSRTRTLYQTGITTNAFEVPSAIAPARYAVWVQSVNSSGTGSDWSPLVEFDLLAPPVIITAGSGQSFNGRPTFVWNTVPNATSYEFRVTPSGSTSPILNVSQITGTSMTPSAAVPAGRYEVTVRALRGGRVFSSWSAPSPLLVRTGPSGLQRTGSLVAGSTGVGWKAVPTAVSYFVEIVSSQTSRVVSSGTATGTTFTPATALGPGKYIARVYATFSGGLSTQWSTPLAIEVFHSAVSITSSNAATADATPNISWTAASGAATYELQVTRAGSSAAVYSAIGISGTTHRIATALPAGQNQIYVRAIHTDGSRSIWSTAQTLLIGPAPTMARTGNSVSWSPINGATHYEFWLNYLGPKEPVQKIVYLSTLVETSATLAPTLPRGRYQLWIRAIRAESGEQYPGLWANLAFDLS